MDIANCPMLTDKQLDYLLRWTSMRSEPIGQMMPQLIAEVRRGRALRDALAKIESHMRRDQTWGEWLFDINPDDPGVYIDAGQGFSVNEDSIPAALIALAAKLPEPEKNDG